MSLISALKESGYRFFKDNLKSVNYVVLSNWIDLEPIEGYDDNLEPADPPDDVVLRGFIFWTDVNDDIQSEPRNFMDSAVHRELMFYNNFSCSSDRQFGTKIQFKTSGPGVATASLREDDTIAWSFGSVVTF